MIDFQNGEYVWTKLRKVNESAAGDTLQALLLPDEQILGIYKGIRDYVVFTDKRFLSVNVQGVSGKKQDITSMPYKRVSVFSVETAGVLGIDSELEMYFSGLGKVRFEFSGSSDIVKIGQMISRFVL